VRLLSPVDNESVEELNEKSERERWNPGSLSQIVFVVD
jgi:triphosphoribosyl-dephospho-CoA synthetase